jgi:hypothetical protein
MSETMKFQVALLVLIFFVTPVLAVEVEIHGFVQGNYAARITGEEVPGPEGGDFLLGEERFRLELTSQGDQAGIVMKVDSIHDAIAEETDLEFREAYVDYIADRYDMRLGRQIITRGVGDLLFINDVYPKDWVAFFSGRPIEYLKVGVDGVKLDGYSNLVNAELVVIPFFEPDRLPASDRFFLFDPFATITTRTKTEPGAEFEKTELALRLYRYIGNWDTALYVYRGFWRQPGMRLISPTSLELFFPKLSVYGASAQAGILGGVVSLEAGYYDSQEDRGGTDPSIPNSQVRYLVGHQRQLWSDFTVGTQYYAEWMRHHSAYRASLSAGFPEQDRLRHLITMRLTQLLRHQTLRLSLFAFYSPSDEDYFFIAEVRYSFTDELWAALGGNVFGGATDTTMFGQLNKNDNLYLAVRYEF